MKKFKLAHSDEQLNSGTQNYLFFSTCTRLYTLLYQLVGWSVTRSICPSVRRSVVALFFHTPVTSLTSDFFLLFYSDSLSFFPNALSKIIDDLHVSSKAENIPLEVAFPSSKAFCDSLSFSEEQFHAFVKSKLPVSQFGQYSTGSPLFIAQGTCYAQKNPPFRSTPLHPFSLFL